MRHRKNAVESGVEIHPGSKVIVWEACVRTRPATVVKIRRKIAAYRVRYEDNGDLNTVSWYSVFPATPIEILNHWK